MDLCNVYLQWVEGTAVSTGASRDHWFSGAFCRYGKHQTRIKLHSQYLWGWCSGWVSGLSRGWVWSNPMDIWVTLCRTWNLCCKVWIKPFNLRSELRYSNEYQFKSTTRRQIPGHSKSTTMQHTSGWDRDQKDLEDIHIITWIGLKSPMKKFNLQVQIQKRLGCMRKYSGLSELKCNFYTKVCEMAGLCTILL